MLKEGHQSVPTLACPFSGEGSNMSQQSRRVADTNVSGNGTGVVLPPDEKFWQRYSPHHEFPLSSVTSICLYALAGLLMWVLVTFAIRKNEDNRSLPSESITVGELGGGGGSPEGQGEIGPGDAPPVHGNEAVANAKTDPVPPPVPANDQKLAEVSPAPPTLPEFKGGDGRLIDASQEAMARFAHLSEDAQKKIMAGLGPSKGQGGPGQGGGKGKGIGKGTGDQVGDGSGQLTQRAKRVLRWVMLFNTLNGNDYLNQLRALGAILAVPDPAGGGYLIIRDLSHLPASGEKGDLSTIQRISWVDSQPASIRSLARALQLPVQPPHIIAFFPEKLEKELLDKELKYSRPHPEDDIKETRFKVVRSGTAYEARVEGQTLR
jgi:hypothetical protein